MTLRTILLVSLQNFTPSNTFFLHRFVVMSNKKARSKRERSSNGSSEEAKSPSIMGFAPTQLTAFILLGIGLSYTLEYREAASEGDASLTCNKYLANYHESEACSGSDVFFIAMKYHSATLCNAIALFATLLAWSDVQMLGRVVACLCMTPLAPTVALLNKGSDLLHYPQLKLMLTFCAIGLLIGSSTINEELAPYQQFRISLPNLNIVSIVLVCAWCSFQMLTKGAEVIVTLEPENITQESRLLVQFIVIDIVTIMAILCCALLFFNERRKWVSIIHQQCFLNSVISMHLYLI